MKTIVVISILLTMCITLNAKAQNALGTFDFWVGNWDAYWNDTLNGSNSISKSLNDFVIEENFASKDKSFTGKSWTVYDSTLKIWNQTWVDNSGAYIVLSGGKEGENVALTLTAPRKTSAGKDYYMRMIFYNIKQDSFDWDWQRSMDKTEWKTVWAIKYRRKLG